MTGSGLCGGTLDAAPPELAREVSRALAAFARQNGTATPDAPASDALTSETIPPGALLGAGVHALHRVVAGDCETRAAAVPLLAADALITRAMERAAAHFANAAELRAFAEEAMVQLAATAPGGVPSRESP